MRRKKYEQNESTIARRKAEGRGTGEGESYRPQLEIRDVPSHGRRHRSKSRKSGRTMHLMSDVENDISLMKDDEDSVLDINEQFPLDSQTTYGIACEMGVEHPTNRDGGLNVRTTDMLVIRSDSGIRRQVATAVKYDKKNLSARDWELLEIERRSWKKKGVAWELLTREDVDPVLVMNIKALRAYYDLTGVPEAYEGCFSEIRDFVLRTGIRPAEVRASDWCESIDMNYRVPVGTTLCVFKHLLAIKQIKTDLRDASQIEHRPLSAFVFAKPTQ